MNLLPFFSRSLFWLLRSHWSGWTSVESSLWTKLMVVTMSLSMINCFVLLVFCHGVRAHYGSFREDGPFDSVIVQASNFPPRPIVPAVQPISGDRPQLLCPFRNHLSSIYGGYYPRNNQFLSDKFGVLRFILLFYILQQSLFFFFK